MDYINFKFETYSILTDFQYWPKKNDISINIINIQIILNQFNWTLSKWSTQAVIH